MSDAPAAGQKKRTKAEQAEQEVLDERVEQSGRDRGKLASSVSHRLEAIRERLARRSSVR